MSRSPDMIVKAMNKATDEKSRVGAAWINADGSISVALNPFTVLTASPDLVINLFPNDHKKAA